MRLLDNYIAGQWVPAGSNPTVLLDAVHGHEVAGADASNVDLGAAFEYARTEGSRELQAHDVPRARAGCSKPLPFI